MSKIIMLHRDGKKRTHKPTKTCHHKEAIVYRHERTVYCTICGQELDAFDVLVSLVEKMEPGEEDEALRLLDEPPE